MELIRHSHSGEKQKQRAVDETPISAKYWTTLDLRQNMLESLTLTTGYSSKLLQDGALEKAPCIMAVIPELQDLSCCVPFLSKKKGVEHTFK